MTSENRSLKIVPNSNQSISSSLSNDDIINKKYSSGGGNGGMDNNYVTHKELQTELKLLETKIDGRFNTVDGRFDVIDEKFNTTNAKIDNINKLQWWIMGLIAAGIIVPAVTIVVKTIFTK